MCYLVMIEQAKIELGFKAQRRQVAVADRVYTLRETEQPYGNQQRLSVVRPQLTTLGSRPSAQRIRSCNDATIADGDMTSLAEKQSNGQ
jgi:hypothetical protein